LGLFDTYHKKYIQTHEIQKVYKLRKYTEAFWNSNRLLKLYSIGDAIIKVLDDDYYFF